MEKYLDLLILICTLGALMWAMLRFMLRDIHKDLSQIKEEMKRSETRIDHLYQICIEMLGTRHKH